MFSLSLWLGQLMLARLGIQSRWVGFRGCLCCVGDSGFRARGWPGLRCPLAEGQFNRRGKRYHRLVITCPRHAGCKKYRNTHAKQCATLGPDEPLAYLACWALDAGRRSAGSHRLFWLSCCFLVACVRSIYQTKCGVGKAH